MTDQGIGSWPYRRARIRPSGVALQQGDRALTYAALAERVDRLAGALAARGVRRGDRVAYLGWNDTAAFEVFFAAGRLGALFIPLNARLAAPEISCLLDDAEPAALFYGTEHQEVAGRTAARVGLVAGPQEHEALITDGGLGGPPPPGACVSLDDDAVILYTSGTTGRPKGVVLTHGNLLFNTMNQLAQVDVLSTDTALCVAPVFHATGLGQVSLPTLFKGGTVVVAPRFEASAVLAAIEELGIASFSGVPTMLRMLSDHPDFVGTELSSLRYVIYGGSPVEERVALAWHRRGVPLLQGYGMTEASPGVTLAIPAGADERPLSAGLPHFFTDVTLRPLSTDGERSPDGAGELLVRGPNVFRGYWRRPADTSAALKDGWFRSGDVVRMDEDGWAYIVDRVKDVIISGGENIYPAEVESCINTLDGVRESAVVGVPDGTWGEVGLAYVVRSAPCTVTEDAILNDLRGRIAAFKIPKRVRIVDRLPRTAIGKIMRSELKNPATEPSTDGQGASGPEHGSA
ncbi:long-chain fatty acid--CoA ligase [Streptomyces sp. NPDC048527]|uniref:acyl-CoA synthetase n=1 Tax=Streptomyces sp. NPDC048527 TaxID=3365568 RepID=UPI0037190208